MNTVVIDTNGFIRLLLNDIPLQADKVEQFIKQAKKDQVKIIVPQIILFEIEFTLRKYYKAQKPDIIEKLNSLLSASYLAIESKELFGTALAFYERNTVSFVDCFLLACAQKGNAELFTFDKKLTTLYKQQSPVSNGAGTGKK